MCFGKINSGMKMPTDNLRTNKTNDQNVNQIVSVVEESIKIMPDSLKVEHDNKRKEDIDYSRFIQPMNRPYYSEAVNPWPIINGPIRPIDGNPTLPIDNPNNQEINDEKQPIDKKNDQEISVKHPWSRPYYPEGSNPRPIINGRYPDGSNPRPIILDIGIPSLNDKIRPVGNYKRNDQEIYVEKQPKYFQSNEIKYLEL